jgi:protein-S-isoprenylcysteine O-methyltransferase Ste14
MATWAGITRVISRTGTGAIVAGVGLASAVRPSPAVWGVAALLALAGALVRFWSAGIIAKNQELATSGPYAYVRNPLYSGSLLIALGFLLLNGNPWFGVPVAVAAVVVYTRTIRAEEVVLTERFGDAFRDYRARVPAVIPWRGRCRMEGGETAYSLDQSIKNREYAGALGTLGLLALFYAYVHWVPQTTFRVTTGLLALLFVGVRGARVIARERRQARAAQAAPAEPERPDVGTPGA